MQTLLLNENNTLPDVQSTFLDESVPLFMLFGRFTCYYNRLHGFSVHFTVSRRYKDIYVNSSFLVQLELILAEECCFFFLMILVTLILESVGILYPLSKAKMKTY